MQLFLFLVAKLIPLYLLIAVGFVAAKYLNAKKETLASLLIYVIAPVVVFYGVATTKLTVSALTLPIIFFVFSSGLCLVFYMVGKKIWTGPSKNILAFAAGSGNTGYFGLPAVVALFGQQYLGIAVLCTLGIIFYESSLGFFITARGHHTAKEALIKVLKLPALYAFILAVLVNLGGVNLGSIAPWLDNFKGAYSILGMMIVGMGIAGVNKLQFDLKFTALTFLAKFLAWPALMGGLIYLDTIYFHQFPTVVHHIMLLLAIVPLAANTVSYATELNAEPEKSAVAVLLSTLFALVFIPVIVILFF